MAQWAIGQCRSLLQEKRGRIMLPKCYLKRKWNVISCSWQAKLGTLHLEKNYLVAILSFVHGVEGDEATLPSFVTENGPIDASSSSLEALSPT